MSDLRNPAISDETPRNTRQSLGDEIIKILTRYRVQKHHKGSRESRGVRYAVYSGAPIHKTLQQHGHPMTHIDAEVYRRELVARDILELVSRPENVLLLMGGRS